MTDFVRKSHLVKPHHASLFLSLTNVQIFVDLFVYMYMYIYIYIYTHIFCFCFLREVNRKLTVRVDSEEPKMLSIGIGMTKMRIQAMDAASLPESILRVNAQCRV